MRSILMLKFSNSNGKVQNRNFFEINPIFPTSEQDSKLYGIKR
jgi:hypothetical protein